MDYTAPSGAKVVIDLASVELAADLLRAVLEKATVSSVKDLDEATFLRILVSKDVEDLLFKCMERTTYNGLKIIRDTFKSEESRSDYIPILGQVLRRNIAPFFANPPSK